MGSSRFAWTSPTEFELEPPEAEKFDESEPRDAEGKWTAGSAEAAVARLKDKGIRLDPTGMHPDLVKPVAETLLALKERFPKQSPAQFGVKIGYRGAPGAAVAYTVSQYGKSTILLDPRYWGDENLVSAASRADPEPYGPIDYTKPLDDQRYEVSPSIAGLITHEYGHVVDAETTWYASDMLKGQRGGYASQKAREGGHERFAEAWADYASKPQSQWSGDAKRVDNYFRRQGKVAKFDESEARDEAGRWTATGQRDDIAAALPTVEVPTAHPERLSGAVKQYAEAHPETQLGPGMESAGPQGEAAITQLGDLQQDFPGVPIAFVDIQPPGTGMFGGQNASLSPAVHIPGIAEPGSTILLNGKFFGQDGISLHPPAFGWHPFGVGNAAGTVTHEYGHALDHALNRASGEIWQGHEGDRSQWTEWRSEAARNYYENKPGNIGRMSTYARSGNDFREAFAELFSAAYTPGAGIGLNGKSVFTADQQSNIDSLRGVLRSAGIYGRYVPRK